MSVPMLSMEVRERICKLCLQKCGRNFQEIEDNMKNVLEILLPKIDFTVTKGPVMCEQCTEMVINCFDFKATCLDTHDYIVPFIANKGVNKLDLKDVYASKNVSCGGVSEYYKVCGFCMSLVNDCSTVSFDVQEEGIRLEEMIKQCLPELDFSFIKKPVSCAPCHRSLKNCFYFLMNCLTVEENIQKYCEPLYTNAKDEVDQSSFLLIVRDTENELDDNPRDIIKGEKQFEEKVNLRSEIGNGGNADGEIKNKNGSDIEQDGEKAISEQKLTPKNMFVCEKDGNKFGTIKTEEDFCEIRDQVCLLNEELEIKTNDHEFNSLTSDASKLVTNDNFLGNQKCSDLDSCGLPSHLLLFEADRKYRNDFGKHKPITEDPLERTLSQSECKNASISQTLTPKSYSENTIYQCDSCSFETKHEYRFKSHSLVHKDGLEVTIHRCESCPFQMKYKVNLRTHMLIHKGSLKVTMYRCDSCSYQTKRRGDLNKHLLVHREPLNLPKYRCGSCPYQTNLKNNLSRHFLVHKDASEVSMYRCESCSFETKYKGVLSRHLLGHKNPSDVSMYRCESCSFETKHKEVLSRHFRIHKGPLEVSMYRCESCSFETKRKGVLRRHLLVHKDLLEVSMHRCASCSYQTKHKDALGKHLLVHKDPSEVSMYRCESCSFQTKRKSNLSKHLLVHKDPSELSMYRCESCSFQTKYQGNLTKHLLVHKNPLEVSVYRCASCSYQTKHKNDLRKHLLLHKNPLEVLMYRCASCSYETKHKKYLRKHLLVHKGPLNV